MPSIQNLVLVESPTKSRMLQKFLGSKYVVEASMGHIRDLPKSDIGVDVEKDFEPRYIVPRDKTKQVNALKKLLNSAKTLWLATDPDREGEAIAWHISELLDNKLKKPDIKRVVFHEITEEAIKEAFNEPRHINTKLVNAQQARRILDRLVGYKLSPVLWKKVKSGLSAGRVQSVALRLIVEREREVQKFKAEEYWSIEVELDPKKGMQFQATVIELNSKKLQIKSDKEAQTHVSKLKGLPYQVSQVTKKEVRRYPAPPFTTSTLQQTASLKLGFTAKKTMTLAQFLYEHGLITYMRTDSVNLAPQAISSAREYIQSSVGKNYLPSSPRIFKTKSKSAQEAHEAIRPTSAKTLADSLKSQDGITRDHIRLYELIWKRFVACQMVEAVLDQTTIDIKAGEYLARASGSVIKFDGWLRVYGIGQDDEEPEEAGGKVLPEVVQGQSLDLVQVLPNQHFTQPPPRYNEASLIKKLEELGIGRPSTYAPIISTITDRYYVEKQERKFIPTSLGFAVTDFLLTNFPDIIDFSFTAQMEGELDEIAEGERKWQPTIKAFFDPFTKKIDMVVETSERVKIEAEETDKVCPLCGKNLLIKFGRFGKFLACSGFPDCKHTERLEETVDVNCPDCGSPLVVRRTKKGRPFYGCKSYPNCKFAAWQKPKSGAKPSEVVAETATE